jgi:sigma-E factor negative regulatory protein RseA
MVESVKEQLSACLDGELPERELSLLSKRLAQDVELQAAMSRYALISETLRTGEAAHPANGFADAVMAKLAQEAPLKKVRGISPVLLRRLRPAAGIAVAASVAALAVFSVQQSGLMPTQMVADQTAAGPTGQLLANSGQAPATSTVAAQQASDRYVVPAQSSNTSAFIPAARLTNYVVAHSEYSSPLGRRSVLSGVLAEGEAQSDDDLVEDVTVREEPAAQ